MNASKEVCGFVSCAFLWVTIVTSTVASSSSPSPARRPLSDPVADMIPLLGNLVAAYSLQATHQTNEGPCALRSLRGWVALGREGKGWDGYYATYCLRTSSPMSSLLPSTASINSVHQQRPSRAERVTSFLITCCRWGCVKDHAQRHGACLKLLLMTGIPL
jgi:hypothetical protein